MKIPTLGTLLRDYGTFTATTTITTPNARCLITGSAAVLGNGNARVHLGNSTAGVIIAGIPYTEGTNTQVAFSFLAGPEQQLYLDISNGQIQSISAYEIDWV